MFKGAKLSQDLSVTKPYFECSIWTLSFFQPFFLSSFDGNVDLLSIAWT